MPAVIAFSVEDCWGPAAPVPGVGAPLTQWSSCGPHSLLHRRWSDSPVWWAYREKLRPRAWPLPISSSFKEVAEKTCSRMAFHPTGSKAGNLHSPAPYAEASGGPALPVARWAVLPILGPTIRRSVCPQIYSTFSHISFISQKDDSLVSICLSPLSFFSSVSLAKDEEEGG